MVRDTSRFWNVSGISITAGANGFKLDVASMQALLAGGVKFDTPPSLGAATRGHGRPRRSGCSRPSMTVSNAAYTQRMQLRAYFDGSVRGLKQDAPVEVRGIGIGRVLDVHLEVDAANNRILIPVTMEIEPERIMVAGGGVEQADPTGKFPMLRSLVERGLRGQLRTGSLITGDLFVALDFFPDAEPAEITLEGNLPILPTVPTQLESVTASLNNVLQRVSALPIEGLMDDLRRTVQGVEEPGSLARDQGGGHLLEPVAGARCRG